MPTRLYRHIDPALLLQTLEGDLSIYRELAAIFVRTVPPLLDQAEAAFAGRDWPALVLASHSIAGAATVMGAGPLADRARAVEAEARRASDAQLPEQMARLAAELDGTLEEVEHSLCHNGGAA